MSGIGSIYAIENVVVCVFVKNATVMEIQNVFF